MNHFDIYQGAKYDAIQDFFPCETRFQNCFGVLVLAINCCESTIGVP